MCGIAGAAFFEVADRDIKKALGAMQRRGPDGNGLFHEGQATLGHTRLAIIDLTQAAAQPMSSACGRYAIVFNGEIYNYQELRRKLEGAYNFQSHSDTEVILALYAMHGERALEHLRGMFAFAIWDREREALFLARDRLGVKPLYFASVGERFAFASRPHALFQIMRDLDRGMDPQALRYFLEAGYVPAPLSIFRGMNKLEPGHHLMVTRSKVIKKRYWSLDGIAPDPILEDAKESDLLDELDSLIDESVRLRMVSDVPVGAFLSGGIDSSLVTAAMVKQASGSVRTFTIGFSEKAFDESKFARAIASALGTNHTSNIMAADDLMTLMPTFIQQYDEPFFDYSAFPVMAVSRLAKQSVGVSLSGDGGDELFGGYHYYRIMQGLDLAGQFPSHLCNMLGAILRKLPAQRLKWLGATLSMEDPSHAFSFMRGVIKSATNIMQPSLLKQTQSLGDLFEDRSQSLPHGLSFAERAMRIDMAYTLPDDYLQKVDVGSMAFSLEVRNPFLDHTLAEWAARLPLCWKIRRGTPKYLLRQLAYRKMPRDLLDRRKMGFGLPMAQWLRSGLKDWGDLLLSDDESLEAIKVNSGQVRSLWNAHQSGKMNAHTTLWSVLVLLQFYQSQKAWS